MYTVTIHPATRDDITALDLQQEMSAMDARGDEYECYTASAYNADTTERDPSHDMQIVWLPHGRAGICTNANSDWADYATVEQAASDYLNDPEEYEARN